MTPEMTLYNPAAALVVFTAKGRANPYLEYYDMDDAGCPVNPRPLSVREAQSLAKALDTRGLSEKAFLKPQGLLPSNVLHIDPADNGRVLWHTKAQRQKLYFTKDLGIPDAEVSLPALIWRADKKHLHIFAVATKAKPKANTPLYHAPFFNLYHKGNVCMGTVDVKMRQSASLEEFIQVWQGYFFGSYFSHHIDSHNPINGNLTSLYKDLIKTGQDFPLEVLLKTERTLKDLL